MAILGMGNGGNKLGDEDLGEHHFPPAYISSSKSKLQEIESLRLTYEARGGENQATKNGKARHGP